MPVEGGSSTPASGQPTGEPQPGRARLPPPLATSTQPHRGRDSSPDADSDAGSGSASNLTSVPVSPTKALSLPACPEESPLLVGPMLIEFNIPVDLELLAKQNPEMKMGGCYTLKD
ncbi:Beta-1,4-galactosyltransferase 1 [Heterocephalus glaber]|uniref:Beta-1,4-galactosyltransferase 1 n=1 Tax=Heterocephalus glaber TaxID=10181 RepID=G5B534_HETGA|nr:Beta-1,4-galactosyltransferase 1 [Heterocephalus glaber]